MNNDLVQQIADKFGLDENETAIAVKFLKKHGWLTEETHQAVEEATKAYQATSGLPPTGEITRQTLRNMALPRCGFPDFPLMTAETRWSTKSLTYYVENYVGGLSQSDQDDLIKMAYDSWSEVADIHFARTANKSQASIVIGAGRGRAAGFDGPLGILAFAELPQGNNAQLQLMMDLDESWTRTISQDQHAILFLNVFCHETGHTLGLDHSTMRSALMYPTYAVGISKPQQQDDVPRIQSLYGAAVSPPVVPSGPTGDFDEVWFRRAGQWVEGYKVGARLL